MAEQSLKDKTAKGLFWGGVSNGVQQILALLFGIFLSRILSPGDYGMVGMLTIFTGFANALQESGFSAALTNKLDIKHEDYNSVFWFNIVVGIGLYVILFFSAPLIAVFFDQPDLLWVSRIVFLSFLFGCFGTAQAAYLFKNLMVKERAKIDIYALLLSNTAALIMALNGMAYWGIAIQGVLYIGLGTFLRWYYSPWRPTFSFNLQPLREMFPFSARLLLTNLFSQMSTNIFSILLGKFYTVQQVGYYSQGYKWMNMGGSFITGMISGVAQPIFAQVSYEKERQVQVLRKMIRFTAFISFPLMFGMALVANELILITVTEKWAPCVPILQLLCVWGAFSPICELYKNIVISHGKSNIYLYANVIFGILQILLLIMMLPYGILWMVAAYVLAYLCWLLVWHCFASHLIGVRLYHVIRDILPYFLITLSALSCAWWVSFFSGNIYIRFALKIIVSAILYIGIMWGVKSVIFKECIGFLWKR